MPSGKKKTHDEFIREMNVINPNIEIIGIYLNDRTKIQCHCKICDNIWEPIPNKLLQRRGCPYCAGNQRLSHTQFVEKMKALNPNIKILDKYMSNNTKIECECLIDHYKWSALPSHLLQGHGCPACANNIKKSHEDFIEELNHVNSNIQIIDTYDGAHKKLKCKCLIDNYEWYATPRHLLDGRGCPICKSSKGEEKCIRFLSEHNICFIQQYTYPDLFGVNGLPLRFDFAIKSNQDVIGLIEYDGIFHYQKLYDDDGYEDLQVHDKCKNVYCETHNIPLLRIPYWEYDNIETNIANFIKNISQLDCEGRHKSAN